MLQMQLQYWLYLQMVVAPGPLVYLVPYRLRRAEEAPSATFIYKAEKNTKWLMC